MTAKERECGNGDPKQRGRNCLGKEADEKTAADVLTKATAAKAVTDRAARIETDMRPIRERLRLAGPIQEANVQGNALAKLFRMPDAEAGWVATLQQFGLAAVVELLIVLSMVAFELLGRDARSKPIMVEPAPQPEPAVEPVATKKAPERPKLVVTNSELVVTLVPLLEKIAGPRSSIVDVHKAYKARCREQSRKPLADEEFGGALEAFCRATGIKTKTIKGMPYLLDVQIVSSMSQSTG